MKTIDTLDNNVFRHLITTIGALPTSFIDSMSYYEMIAWLVNYIQTQVVPAVNNNAEAVKEIQQWIETLDLQDEVDNKLEEMAADGELATIIAQLVDLGCVFAYKTIAEMAAAENLADGSVARVIGNSNVRSGDGDYYIVRPIQNTDVVDGYKIVSLTNTDNLIAERIENVLAKYYIIEEIEIEKGVAANGTEYYIAHIPHTDTNGNVIELKHGMSGDATTQQTVGRLENGLDFAHRKNTTMCVNASIYGTNSEGIYYNKPIGPIIVNGNLVSNLSADPTDLPHTQILGIKRDNSMKVYPLTTLPSELIAEGVYNTVVAFDQLLDDGVRVGTESQTLYSWNLIGQNSDTLDIYIFSCNGGIGIDGQEGMLLDDCVQILANKGCDFAYRLDQGGSTTFVYKGEMLNIPNDDYGQTIRNVPDFLYFNKPLLNKTDIAEASLNASVGNVKAKVDALANKVMYPSEFESSSVAFNYPNVRTSSGDGSLKITYKKNGSNHSTIFYDKDATPHAVAVWDNANEKTVLNLDGIGGLLRVGHPSQANSIELDGSTGKVKVGAKTYADVCETLTQKPGSFSPDDVTATSTYYVAYDAGQSPAHKPYGNVAYVLVSYILSAAYAVQIAIPIHNNLVTGTLTMRVRLKINNTWSEWGNI